MRRTTTTVPTLFARTLAGTLVLGGTTLAVAGPWTTARDAGPPAGRVTVSTEADPAPAGAPDPVPADDQLLVAGPDGEPVLDASGDVLVIDLSEATELLAGDGVPGGVDAAGNAVEWVAHEHVEELLDAGAVTAVDPSDPLLADICTGAGPDPCELAG